MNNLIELIVDTLQNRVMHEGKIVPVIRKIPIEGNTPCITLDDSGGVATLNKFYDTVIIDNAPIEALVNKVHAKVNISLWCDSIYDLIDISDSIMLCFNKMQTNHFEYCVNYQKGTCLNLNNSCESINSNSARGVKNQCPSPKEYGYSNLLTKYKMIPSTFNIEEPFRLDDLNVKQPLYRNVFKTSAVYYTYYNVGGGVINDINIYEELL